MISSVRNTFNQAFTDQKYQQMLASVSKMNDGKMDFRLAETPVFIDRTTKNKLVKAGVSAVPEILLTPYHNGDINKISGHSDNDLYRPLSLVMFAIEYQLFKYNPFPGHLINVFVFIACVLLFFLFLYHLFRKKRPVLAFISALLFAIHPIHTEIVANIKSRDELLCFLFGFLSLNAFVKYTLTFVAFVFQAKLKDVVVICDRGIV